TATSSVVKAKAAKETKKVAEKEETVTSEKTTESKTKGKTKKSEVKSPSKKSKDSKSDSPSSDGEMTMEGLLDAMDYELKAPRKGDVVTGTITDINRRMVLVDIGGKTEGMVVDQ